MLPPRSEWEAPLRRGFFASGHCCDSSVLSADYSPRRSTAQITVGPTAQRMTKDAIGDLSFVLHEYERGPVLRGTPRVITRARQLAEHGAVHAAGVQGQTAKQVHQAIVQTAQRSPNWEGMEDGIFVRHESGRYVFGFDPAHPQAARASELEFGAGEQRPDSVFRKVLVGQRAVIERSYRRALNRWAR